MHPAHVPLEAEAEAAGAGRRGDARVGGRLLGDHHDAGVVLIRGGVRLLEEVDGLEVLAPAVDVRVPLAGLAAVVEVEHRGDGVHAQRVDVVLVHPEAGVGHEEVAHLAPAEVEHVGAPVGVLAAGRIRILVQRRAVEAAEGERVLREVRGHPVHDHADAGLMELVDQILELVGRAEAGVHGVVAGDLVAPRPGERVLRERHELDVRESHGLDVRHELVGELVVVGHVLAPAAGVHFIDAHGAGVRVGGAAVVHPLAVVPVVGGFHDDRAGGRRDLVGAFHRVGLHRPVVVGVENLVLVDLAGLHAGDEDLPHARGADLAHGVAAAVPGVEVADHAHGVGIGRPHGERGADHLLAGRAVGAAHRIVIAQHMRAKSLPEALVAALAEQVGVHLADGRQIAVRIVLGHGRAVLVRGAHAVVGDGGPVLALGGGDDGHEDAIEFVGRRGFAVLGDDGHGLGHGAKHTDRDHVPMLAGPQMPAEHFMGVVEGGVAHRIQVALVDGDSNGIVIDVRVCSHSQQSRPLWAICGYIGASRRRFFRRIFRQSTVHGTIIRVLYRLLRRIHGLQGRRYGGLSASRRGEG